MLKIACFGFLALLVLQISCKPPHAKITYISVEHATVTYVNSKYFANVTTSARRYSRRDPLHYYNLNFTSKIWIGNNLTFDFYFYEFLTNRYKPSFVEMHMKACDMVHNDKFFGSAMKQGKLDRPCPYPPGTYSLWNMSVPFESIPRGFPFTKGRIFCNVSFAPTHEYVGGAHVDMELKQMEKYKGPE